MTLRKLLSRRLVLGALVLIAVNMASTPAQAAVVWAQEAGSFRIVGYRVAEGYGTVFGRNITVQLDPPPAACAGGSRWGTHIIVSESFTPNNFDALFSALLTAVATGQRIELLSFRYDDAQPCDGPAGKILEVHQIGFAP